MMLDAPSRPMARAEEAEIARIVAKVGWRLIPLLVTGFFLSYLDRVNIGFAALTMNRELGFTPEFFGWAAGVFFIGYCLFEAPSNYIMHRVGARLWLARIMVSWGLIAALTAFIWNETSFVALRVLLGIAEAGYPPGVILYLTFWAPAAQRARILAGFLIAVPVSSAIGSTVSSMLLVAMDGVAGISGWRWLFFIEALPTILLGVALFLYLPERPRDAKWLTPAERDALEQALAREAQEDEGDHWRALKDRRVLALGVAYFGGVMALYGLSFWLPQIVQTFGNSVIVTGLITATPYAIGALAMWLWSRSSDLRNESVAHTAIAAFVAALGLVGAAYAQTPLQSMVALTVAAIGAVSQLPTFWSFATQTLGATEAVVGVAIINSIGNMSGFAGPYLVGVIKGQTGAFSSALLALAIGPLFTAALILRIARRDKDQRFFL